MANFTQVPENLVMNATTPEVAVAAFDPSSEAHVYLVPVQKTVGQFYWGAASFKCAHPLALEGIKVGDRVTADHMTRFMTRVNEEMKKIPSVGGPA